MFLAGDAVHLVIPTGGLGMNTGVGDAIDLSWKLAATLQGWGGPKLLASYEIERRQVGARNVAASGFATHGRRRWRALYRPEIREPTPAGAALREELARVADVEQHKATEMIGAELGYRYVGSPLIAAEPGEGPEHDFMTYVPTTWPGARLPHVWLDDGSAMQDRIGYGHGYTLLRLGGTKADASALAARVRRDRRAVAGSRYCRRAGRATSTAMISCCCGRTCTWSGAAMRLRPSRKNWRRLRPGIEVTHDAPAAGDR